MLKVKAKKNNNIQFHVVHFQQILHWIHCHKLKIQNRLLWLTISHIALKFFIILSSTNALNIY